MSTIIEFRRQRLTEEQKKIFDPGIQQPESLRVDFEDASIEQILAAALLYTDFVVADIVTTEPDQALIEGLMNKDLGFSVLIKSSVPLYLDTNI